MSTFIRFVPREGGLYEVTQRCLQGRHLLTRSPRFNRIALGILARAQARYGVVVVDATFLSNHYHLLVEAADTRQLARFMNYLASNLALEAGRLHGWRGRFWAGPYRAILVAADEASQVARLRYLIANACKENLVARPRDWPGLQAAELVLTGPTHRGLWIDRTGLCQARRRRGGEGVKSEDFEHEETLVLSPLPCWAHLAWSEYQERVRALVREVEEDTAARHQYEGTRPLGRRKVLKQNAHRPSPPPERRRRPLIHAVSRAVRQAFVAAYRRVVAAYREASKRLRAGDLDAVFPGGTFPPGLAFVPHEAAAPE
jgi:REP element-mobilizing transposase RayT